MLLEKSTIEIHNVVRLLHKLINFIKEATCFRRLIDARLIKFEVIFVLEQSVGTSAI